MRLFKKILKISGTLLLVVLVAGSLFLAHTWYFKPVNINLFFARTMLQIMLESPEMLSSLRVLEPLGQGRGHALQSGEAKVLCLGGIVAHEGSAER